MKEPITDDREAATKGHVAALYPDYFGGPVMPAKWHVEAAIRHIKIAAEKTRDPGLQGDLERARAKLQRRIDLTQGL